MCSVIHVRLCVYLCVCLCALTLRARVSVGGKFDVVARKQTLPPVDLAFPPITVVLVEHCDHLTLLEGQLVIVLGHVVVHADHLTQSFRTTDRHDGKDVNVVNVFFQYRFIFFFIFSILSFPRVQVPLNSLPDI